MNEEARNIITQSRFFRGLTEDSIARIHSMARLKRYRHGEMIFREGDACPGIFIVGNGSVRIFRTAPSAKQHVLHIASSRMLCHCWTKYYPQVKAGCLK